MTADGRLPERDVALADVRLNGEALPTPVVFADPGGLALLGAVTPEEFGLGVDPLGRRVVPVPSYAV